MIANTERREVIVECDRLDMFMTLTGSAAKSITRIKHMRMAKYGLGSTHMSCLRKLYVAQNGLTRTQLSKLCGLDKAQITRIIGELCKKGFTVEESTGSGYKNKIFLTDIGRETTEEIYRIVLEVNEYVSGGISQEDIDHFYKVFDRICSGLKRAEEILIVEQLEPEQLKKGD